MPLTLDQINQFLKEKIGENSCAVCGVSMWLGPTPDTAVANLPVGPLEMPKGLSLIAGGPVLGSAYVVCSNCGHVVFFAKGIIEAWANAQPDAKK